MAEHVEPGWLNSPPLTAADVVGKVVLVISGRTPASTGSARSLYVRAWVEKYHDRGLVTVGVHTPEFPFEQDVDNIRQAVKDMRIEYPIGIDSDYGVWRAFSNRYWPAVYIADAQGRIRHHQFGEGRYEECERVIQRLLREAGVEDVGGALVSVAADGFETQADWTNLASPETYLGYEQTQNFASPGGVAFDESRTYVAPDSLKLNHWALSGEWAIESGASVLDRGEGGIAFRFHARDAHLVLRGRERGMSVPFRVLIDGETPGDAHGSDVDEEGHGVVTQSRLYQLVREQGSITDRTFEITFLAAGIEAYVFTFG